MYRNHQNQQHNHDSVNVGQGFFLNNVTDSANESKNTINFYYHNMSGMRSALSEFKNDASSSNYFVDYWNLASMPTF